MPNDNPALLVREMSDWVIGVKLDDNDISVAHRLPSTKKVKDRLIVKFTRREKRDEVYKKRKNLKSKQTKDLPSVARQPESPTISHKAEIHINESLTPYRKRLFGRLLEYIRSHSYKFIWTTNGTIMLRETDSSSALCFRLMSNWTSSFSSSNLSDREFNAMSRSWSGRRNNDFDLYDLFSNPDKFDECDPDCLMLSTPLL